MKHQCTAQAAIFMPPSLPQPGLPQLGCLLQLFGAAGAGVAGVEAAGEGLLPGGADLG
jgi:hypothetical protein